jgi:hypothetical protein
LSDYLKSAKAAIAEARRGFVKIAWQDRRVKAVKTSRGYRTWAAKVEIPVPDWPEDPRALFLKTIEDRYIDDPEDPVILQFLGEA